MSKNNKTDFELMIEGTVNNIVDNMSEKRLEKLSKLLGCHSRIDDVDFTVIDPKPSQQSRKLAEDIAVLTNGYTFRDLFQDEDEYDIKEWAGDGSVGLKGSWGGNHGYDSVIDDAKDPIIWHYDEAINCCDSETYEGVELTDDEVNMIDGGISQILKKAVKTILEFFDTNKVGYAEESCCYPRTFYAISEHALAYAIENFNLHIKEKDIELIHSLAKKIRNYYEAS